MGSKFESILILKIPFVILANISSFLGQSILDQFILTTISNAIQI